MKIFLIAPLIVGLSATALADTTSNTASIPSVASPVASYKVTGLHQFNPALGKLNGVTISVRNRFDATGFATTTKKGEFTYKWHARTNVLLSGRQSDGLQFESEEQNQKVAANSTGVARTDVLFPRDSSGAAEWKSIKVNLGEGENGKAADSYFVGTGDIPISFSGSASLQYSKGQGYYAIKTANFSGEIMVTFDYTPNAPANVTHKLGDGNYQFRFRNRNYSGLVAGAVYGKEGRWFPAIFKDGKLVSIAYKGDRDCENERISDDGNLDFEIADKEGNRNSFRSKGSSCNKISVDGYKNFDSKASNSYGRFIGQGFKTGDANDKGEPLFFDGKSFKRIEVEGLTGLCADGMNSKDDVLVHGFDKEGNCNFGVWNRGNWSRVGLTGKNLRPTAINEKGEIAGHDEAGNILLLSCCSSTTIPSPAGAVADINNFREDGTYTGVFHYKDHDEAFRGDAKGFKKLDELAGESGKYVRAEYVKGSGDLMGYDKSGNCYKFETSSLNPLHVNLPLWMLSGAKYQMVVWLSTPAAADTTYNLSFDRSVLNGPKTVTIAKGQTSATIALQPYEVKANTGLKLVVSCDNDVHSAICNVIPFSSGKVSAQNVSVSDNYIAEGDIEKMSIHIATPAPAGGLKILLSGNRPECAGVPTEVVIPEGAQDADFAVPTYNVSQNTPIFVSAQFGTTRISGTFTIRPLKSAALKASTTTAKKGETITFVVTLEGPAPSNGKVLDLQVSNCAISIPTQIKFGAGEKEIKFEGTVTSANKETVIVRAGHGSDWSNFNIKIN